tara:strand:- start:674 stop:841 length:168 start_codon:yes stop_codon:yes gene_type:complete
VQRGDLDNAGPLGVAWLGDWLPAGKRRRVERFKDESTSFFMAKTVFHNTTLKSRR